MSRFKIKYGNRSGSGTISQREVTRQYIEMLRTIEPSKGKVNCYDCEDCGHITKTVDLDDGVTPFIYDCAGCGGDATSTFYVDKLPDEKPTTAWARPTLKECLKLRKKPHLLDHVLKGGLIPLIVESNG